jgi:hypothetical protein
MVAPSDTVRLIGPPAADGEYVALEGCHHHTRGAQPRLGGVGVAPPQTPERPGEARSASIVTLSLRA